MNILWTENFKNHFENRLHVKISKNNLYHVPMKKINRRNI